MLYLNKTQSFAKVLHSNNGTGPGFDLLRLGLALLILLLHALKLDDQSGITTAFIDWMKQSLSVDDGGGRVMNHVPPPTPSNAPASVIGPFIRSLVPMFFALSGFLVAGSALRTPQLSRFLGLRALRIFPALVVEVVLSAVLLGAIFTTLPLGEYFTHPEFLAYFQNIIGYVHFYLPGVFKDSVNTAVNANLWTLPFELESYILMSVFMISGLIRKRGLFTVIFALATIGLIVANVGFGFQASTENMGGRVIVYYFATGVLFFLWRDVIPHNFLLFVFAGTAAYFSLLSIKLIFVTPIFLTYVTMYIGLSRLPHIPLLKTGDYSYGIYLYGFPVTQALLATVDSGTMNFVLKFFLSAALTIAFAVFSWHGVEKHCLKLKKYLVKR